MKKYLAVLTAISIFLFVPMYTRASQSSLETTVPSTHTVTIEAEHASVLYVDGDKGLSSAYPVPRFSNPSFQITAEEGYTIKRVFLNGTDVTKEVKKDILKLSEVCENQVIKIETEAISQEPSQEPSREPQPSQEPQAPQESQPSQDSGNVEETVQKQETEKQETGKQLPGTDSSKTENESDGSDAEKEQEASDNTQEVTNTEDPQEQEESGQTTSGDEMPQNLPEKEKRFNLWWSILALPTTGVIAGGIFFIKRRKR